MVKNRDVQHVKNEGVSQTYKGEIMEKETKETKAENQKEETKLQESEEVKKEAKAEVPDEEEGKSTDLPVVPETTLFGKKPPSEAELTGEEPEKLPEPEKAAEAQPIDSKKKEEPKAKEKEPEKKLAEPEKPEKPSEEPEKPPKGFVPLGALHESRAINRELKDENVTLRNEIITLRKSPEKIAEPEPVEPDFKILTEGKLDELFEEDPKEALKYMNKYNAHVAKQAAWEAKQVDVRLEKRDKEVAVAQKQRTYDDTVDNSFDKLKEEIPGIYDGEEGLELRGKLMNFAMENGFEGDFLKTLTDPGTMVMAPDGDPIQLGDGATGLLKMINKFYTSYGSDNGEEQKKHDEEIRKEEREVVTKRLIKEFKKGNTQFKSLDEIAGSGETPEVGGLLSKAEYSKMTSEERERALSGA